MTKTQTTGDEGGWRVVRILRVAADDALYATADEAAAAAFIARTNDRGHEYAVAHTSYPLDDD